jgi:hypothetical protein
MRAAVQPSSTSIARPAVAIVQSCYIPWKGYFDLIGRVDHFLLYDDVQFVKRHWHNRNRIKTANGPLWLSIPVRTKGRYLQTIGETTVSEKWAEKHWRSIAGAYARAPHFSQYEAVFCAAYETADGMERLSDINAHFLKLIAGLLGIETRVSWSGDYPAAGHKTDRLLDLCRAVGARSYLSGPSARDYFETGKFQAAGIEVEWMDYAGYPEYLQLHGEYDSAVSVLDLIFSTGPAARDYMKFPGRAFGGGA